MKKNSKFILIGIVFTILVGYIFYQNNKINNYKENLSRITKKYIQKFASTSSNTEDERLYWENYASIITAQEAYNTLTENKGIPLEEWKTSLSNLFVELKIAMLNDKEKVKKVFGEEDGAELMFMISEDFEDEDSIKKLLDLLSEE